MCTATPPFSRSSKRIPMQPDNRKRWKSGQINTMKWCNINYRRILSCSHVSIPSFTLRRSTRWHWGASDCKIECKIKLDLWYLTTQRKQSIWSLKWSSGTNSNLKCLRSRYKKDEQSRTSADNRLRSLKSMVRPYRARSGNWGAGSLQIHHKL